MKQTDAQATFIPESTRDILRRVVESTEKVADAFENCIEKTDDVTYNGGLRALLGDNEWLRLKKIEKENSDGMDSEPGSSDPA